MSRTRRSNRRRIRTKRNESRTRMSRIRMRRRSNRRRIGRKRSKGRTRKKEIAG